MSVQYLKSLLYKSALIQQSINAEQKQRWPNSFRLLRLKKIRLHIKDRIRQFRSFLSPGGRKNEKAA